MGFRNIELFSTILRRCIKPEVQHDGIVAIVRAGEESDRAAEGMAKEATAACGYGVKVIPKRAPITVN